MAEQIGVALVGTGFGQKVHLPALDAHHRTQVTAVYHRDLAKAEAIAAKHNIPFASDNLDTVLQHPTVQAVSISTPPFLHYDMAKTAIHAGKHVLLEKPTTLNAQESKDLYGLAASKKVAVTLDFEFRFIPAWQRLQELLQSGYVGKMRYVKIDWLGASRANPQRAWNWYARRDQGGGTLGSIGSHSFDYILWLFGEVTKLSATLSTTIHQRPDPNDGDKLKPVTSDDVCNVTLALPDGTPVQVCLSAVTIQGRGHFVEIYGDQGTLVLGNSSQTDYINGFKLMGSQGGADLAEIEIPDRLAFPRVFDDGRIAPIVRVVNQWVESIDQGQAIAPSLREGTYSQLVMDCCWESHDKQQWVNVPSLDKFLS
ncbi:Gfo/Idh/MocA family oxidoreductase [filamentous cyanobacterium LEGE 11480]|uniref:Gfo/Idh/MocA family oxidoreductase n=1 Tax=Romeriopsis navalis LEGE 11480 TaxID=2777977 RepID=A0A928VNN1_9CYAN|nr:Gfo/Idh/MocA family oxidoreductase [Romeriopsis navalis]MBE9030041.1 Gfo/Idh/MocA family oxidoreductase [Romeriopsis navalis LEGE 11480]